MTRREELHTVGTDTSVAELLDRMLVDRHTGYPVMDGGRLVGMVTLDDARSIKEVERDAYRVKDVMSAELTTISPDADAMTALQRMQERKVGRLPVVDHRGEIIGLISRSDLVTAFNVIQSRGTVPSLSVNDTSDLPNPR
jgi:CBS domain-containing protein